MGREVKLSIRDGLFSCPTCATLLEGFDTPGDVLDYLLTPFANPHHDHRAFERWEAELRRAAATRDWLHFDVLLGALRPAVRPSFVAHDEEPV